MSTLQRRLHCIRSHEKQTITKCYQAFIIIIYEVLRLFLRSYSKAICNTSCKYLKDIAWAIQSKINFITECWHNLRSEYVLPWSATCFVKTKMCAISNVTGFLLPFPFQRRRNAFYIVVECWSMVTGDYSGRL